MNCKRDGQTDEQDVNDELAEERFCGKWARGGRQRDHDKGHEEMNGYTKEHA